MTDNKFEIIDIPAPDFEIDEELDGIIPKGWIETERFGIALFKVAGDLEKITESRTDWSEKVVAEINQLVKLPTAGYELAVIDDGDEKIPGTLSIDLLQPGDEKRFPLERLLAESIDGYDYAFDYQVDKVIQILSDNNIGIPPNSLLPEGINNGADMLTGVLMMDATVGNCDRHDRNLDIVQQKDGQLYLSPVFDQGFSLGATEDKKLKEWVDPKHYNKYYNFSSFGYQGEDISGLEAFKQAAELRPEAAKIWLKELQKIDNQQIKQIFKRIPEQIITLEDRQFALDLLEYNRNQLLEVNLDPSLAEKKLAFQEVQLSTQSVDESKVFENVLFEVASSAKYIALNKGIQPTGGKKQIVFDLNNGVRIENNSQSLSIIYDDRTLQFDSDFNVVKNELKNLEVRQIEQLTKEVKQQTLKQNSTRQIQPEIER